ncbi:peroxynitrite isomerase THAP4 [Patella vulgata]|uniref:peroxynitrite isomerase THAP4 n=1 Tax=Patella vulgata TaxID=6465 RepID=UPI00217FE43F|nr:peroxynitrite isomerase THAP4 [Patella vulgata]
MVKFCCAVGCSNQHRTGSGLTFHRFPLDQTMCLKWCKAVNRLDLSTNKLWKPSKFNFLCSSHFKADDFYMSKHGTMRLIKKGVVPSIFSWKTQVKVPITHRTSETSLKAGVNQVEASTSLLSSTDSIATNLCTSVKPLKSGKVAASTSLLSSTDSIATDHRTSAKPLKSGKVAASTSNQSSTDVIATNLCTSAKPLKSGKVAASTSLLSSTDSIATDHRTSAKPLKSGKVAASTSNQSTDVIATDHTYFCEPATLKQKYDEILQELQTTKKDLYNSKKREKRARYTIQLILEDLKESKQLNEKACEMLNSYKS